MCHSLRSHHLPVLPLLFRGLHRLGLHAGARFGAGAVRRGQRLRLKGIEILASRTSLKRLVLEGKASRGMRLAIHEPFHTE